MSVPRLRVLMLFLDGVGIGSRDGLVNPFFAARMPTLRGLLDGDLPSLDRPQHVGRLATLLPLDATLGVPGLPQSGTGQMALLTGINGARLIGKHFGPHPYSTRSHTRNPVPLIVVTTRHRDVARQIEDRGGGSPNLTHVLPVLLETMCPDAESRRAR